MTDSIDDLTTTTLSIRRPRSDIALVTFERPSTLNSMTLQFVQELETTLDTLADDRTIRVVILTGAGRGFSSGHDLTELDEGATGPEQLYPVQEAFARLIVRINSLPQPVIAAVNGAAAGGGMAMALAADIRLCDPSARFNAAFVRLGLSGCDVGTSYLLPRIVGPTLAFEMMLTGRLVDATEAERSGLVLRVTAEGAVIDEALAVAEAIGRNAPFAVTMTKQVMWTNLDAPGLRTAIELENRTQVLCTSSPDHTEALNAFVDRREPRF